MAIFASFTICSTGLDFVHRSQLEKLVSSLGGTFAKKFVTDQVTHLISSTVVSAKYKAAVQHEVPIVTLQWVKDCHAQRKLLSIDSYKLPAFSNCAICLSGFPFDRREELGELIEKNGGKYSKHLIMGEVTHLIGSEPSGLKYSHALKWEIHVVTVEWLIESVSRGVCLDEEDYLLREENDKVVSLTKEKEKVKLNDNNNNKKKYLVSSDTITSKSNSNSSSEKQLFEKKSIEATATRTNSAQEKDNNDTIDLERERLLIQNILCGKLGIGGFRTSTRHTPSPLLFHYRHSLEKQSVVGNAIGAVCGSFLTPCRIFLVGFSTERLTTLELLIRLGGGMLYKNFYGEATHIIGARTVDYQYLKRLRQNASAGATLVSPQWLEECLRQGKLLYSSKFPWIDRKGVSAIDRDTLAAKEKKDVFPQRKNSLKRHPTMNIFQMITLDGDMGNGDNEIEQFDDDLTDTVEGNGYDSYYPPKKKKRRILHRSSSIDRKSSVSTKMNRTLSLPVSSSSKMSQSKSLKNGNKTSQPFTDIAFHTGNVDEMKIAAVDTMVRASGGHIVKSEEDARYKIVEDGKFSSLKLKKNATPATPTWLALCLKYSMHLNVKSSILFTPLPMNLNGTIPSRKLPQRLAGSISLSVTGYEMAGREVVGHLARALGCKYSQKMCSSCTHLICKRPEGEKWRKAQEWGIPAVTRHWLEAVARTGTLQPLEEYKVGTLLSPSERQRRRRAREKDRRRRQARQQQSGGKNAHRAILGSQQNDSERVTPSSSDFFISSSQAKVPSQHRDHSIPSWGRNASRSSTEKRPLRLSTTTKSTSPSSATTENKYKFHRERLGQKSKVIGVSSAKSSMVSNENKKGKQFQRKRKIGSNHGGKLLEKLKARVEASAGDSNKKSGNDSFYTGVRKGKKEKNKIGVSSQSSLSSRPKIEREKAFEVDTNNNDIKNTAKGTTTATSPTNEDEGGIERGEASSTIGSKVDDVKANTQLDRELTDALLQCDKSLQQSSLDLNLNRQPSFLGMSTSKAIKRKRNDEEGGRSSPIPTGSDKASTKRRRSTTHRRHQIGSQAILMSQVVTHNDLVGDSDLLIALQAENSHHHVGEVNKKNSFTVNGNIAVLNKEEEEEKKSNCLQKNVSPENTNGRNDEEKENRITTDAILSRNELQEEYAILQSTTRKGKKVSLSSVLMTTAPSQRDDE
eukprot:g3884.t1